MKWLDDFYTNAERNIPGYKRPANWQERIQKLVSKKPKPARESQKG